MKGILMLRITVLLILCLLAADSLAANQQCICVPPNNCALTADPYAPPAAGQPETRPTSCTVYDASGGVIASAAVVSSSVIPASNAGSCNPVNTYPTSPAGSVSCLVAIGPYAAGQTLTFFMTTLNPAAATAANPKGESVKTGPFSFDNVTSITVTPPPVVPAPPGHPHRS